MAGDELQKIWQSQRVETMPSFAVLDDVAVTPRLPYAREARWWVAASRFLVGLNFALQWRHAMADLEKWGIAIGFMGGLMTAVYVLFQKDRSPTVELDVSLEEYRGRFHGEMARQVALERRELLVLWVTFVIACALIGVARGELWLPLFGLALILVERWRRRKLYRLVDSSSSSS